MRRLALLPLLLLCSAARADEVVLEDGRRYRGKVTRTKKWLQVRGPLRVVTLPARSVLQVVKTSELDGAAFTRVTGPVGTVDPKLRTGKPLPLEARPVAASAFGRDGRVRRRMSHPKHGLTWLTYQLTEIHPTHYVLSGIERRHRIHLACEPRMARFLHAFRAKGVSDAAGWLEMARFSRLAGWLTLAEQDLAKASSAPRDQVVAERKALDAARAVSALPDAWAALARHDRPGAIARLKKVAPHLEPPAVKLLTRLRGERKPLQALRARLAKLASAAALAQADALVSAAKALTPRVVDPGLARRALAVAPAKDAAGLGRELEQIRLVVLYGTWLTDAALERLDARRVRDAESLIGELIAATPKQRATLLGTKLPPLAKALPVPVWAALVRGGAGRKLEASAPRGQALARKVGKVEYVLRVPRAYRPGVPTPLLLVLHGQDDDPKLMLRFWGRHAERWGMVLASVEYVVHKQLGYQHSWEEHRTVLRTLIHVAEGFSVDPDRVFLSGHSLGGHAAYDIALSHPDRFAGVVPIIGSHFAFEEHYRKNARHVPIYCIDGEHDFAWTARNRKQLQACLRRGADVTYAEFQTRGHEGFYEELPWVALWMRARRRDPFPRRLELRSGRPTDLRRFWVRIDEPAVRFPKKALTARVPERVIATITARATTRNELRIRAKGVEALTVLLSERLVDFARPVKIRINRKVRFRERVEPSAGHLLRDFLARGDRRMLFSASVELEVP